MTRTSRSSTRTSRWQHEGPRGPDAVEWWTRADCPIGVTRSRNENGISWYTVAVVADGLPASGTEYDRYELLHDALVAALNVSPDQV